MFGALCVMLQPILIHILTYKCTKSIAWFIHVLYLFIIHILKIPDGIFQSWLEFNDEQHYILTLTMCWIHLRSISHNIDTIDDKLSTSNNFIKKLAYCLYLPTLFLGPLILYHEFHKSVCIRIICHNIYRISKFNFIINEYIPSFRLISLINIGIAKYYKLLY